ncbi:YSC84-related protein [Bacteroidota bacterium]
MKTISCYIIIVIACLISSGLLFSQNRLGGWDPEALENAENTIKNYIEKDPELQIFFDKAYGYAVFPTIGKGAIGIGGAHGGGTVFEQGNSVGKTSMTQITIGLQFGGQAYSEIIFFENKKTLDLFKTSRFELGAQASAVAVTIGASADLAYTDGVAIVTMAKGGLMYEASVGGQKFEYEAVNELKEDQKVQDDERRDE